MIVTDSIKFAKRYIDFHVQWQEISINALSEFGRELLPNSKSVFVSDSILYCNINSVFEDIYLIEFAEESQYDLLIKNAHDNIIQKNTLCIAGNGKKFHGFRNRTWESLQGNIHLSAYFKPNIAIKNYGIGFLILSAISVVMAVDGIKGLNTKSKIKWVNDILINNSKICGVLAHTFAQGEIVSDAILGIGLNVEQTPQVEPTLFVPKSACLNDFLSSELKTTESEVFRYLLNYLNINYNLLISGAYDSLLRTYIDRSAIINKLVSIWSDSRDGTNIMLRKGKVINIGENLELYLDDSSSAVYDGRLAIEEDK